MREPFARVPGIRIALAVMAAVALTATSCSSGSGTEPSGSAAASGGPAKEGGTLRIAAFDGIDSMNPYVGVNDDSYATYEYIYPQLVQYDENVAFAPDFATDWSSSKDGLKWTFHTQPNAMWSDGEPLTAEDVVWTYQTIIKFKDTVTGGAAGSVAHLKKVAAPDPTTVVFTYDVPVPSVLANVQQVSILPEHVWSQYAAGDGKALKTYPNTPTDGAPVVSGGPFMVTQYQQDQVTLFQRNPNYYGTPPHIDGFGLQYFSNEDAEVTAMKNDEIDVIESVPPTSVTTLQDAGFNVYTGDALTYRTFIINSSPYKKEHLELLDPKVREAFEYATDRQKIVDTAWLGYATPGSTIVPPSTGDWHDSSIQPLPFDLAKANELLDGLGFTKGSDSIRVADGHPMQYDVLFPGSERGAGDRAFQIIQSDFAEIGVKLVQRSVSGAYSIMTAPDNRYENWDLAMWNWTPPIDPDFILSVMTCNSFGNWSDSAYCNDAYDKLYDQQGQTLDPVARRDIVYEMQKMVYDDRPYIVLVYNDTINSWSDGWDGFVQSSQGLFSALTKYSLISVHQV
jgi:peptide/nickel transport system substrate-binding protein